jgi:IclR family transcriptional regulator, acetate operon repressor
MNEESATAAATKSKKTKIQVIARAASVLRELEHEPSGLSLGAIAQRLKLPRSTVQRIVGALEAENLLIAASPNGRVKLGPTLLRLSASVDTSTSAIAKPHMIEIARDLGETVDLSVMGRDHAIFIDQAIGGHRPDAISAIADKFPLHCTANGKSMLALLTDAEIEQKIGRVYPARTEFTRTTLSALLPDVHEARRTGLTYDLQEHTLGVCAVGVGFLDALGNRLALSIPIATVRFGELKTKAAQRLTEVRDLLVSHFSSK